MNHKKFLFISRKSSHYRYYQKLVDYLGEAAELRQIKTFVFPRVRFWKEAGNLDLAALVDVHIKRKKVRHPLLSNNLFLLWLVKKYLTFRERARASYYLWLFKNADYGTVVLWNGMKQPNKTPYEVAKHCGLKTMLFENGLLPNTTVLDPRGVNALNSMPRLSEFYQNLPIGDKSLRRQLDVRAPHKNRKNRRQDTEIPERYVFVPFQVPNDTQIVCHSPWIDSMESFYEKLEHALNYLESLVNWKPFKIVVKEHPSWPRSFHNLHDKNNHIVFANEHNTQTLIENAIAVMTINSTVGVEGLLLGKKVITLGDSFINVPGVCWHAHDQVSLNHILSNIDTLDLDKKLITGFLNFLKNDYLIPDAWQKVTKDSTEHLEAIRNRLENPYQP